MANRGLPQWTIGWFVTSSLICIWDASFILLRPHTLPGGKYEAFWSPYKYYISVDKRYADVSDDFTTSISLLNYAEVILSFLVVFLNMRGSINTVPTAFMTSVMTGWKTVLYFAMYIVSVELRQNITPMQHIFIFIIPNGIWILVPFLVMFSLWDQGESAEKKTVAQNRNRKSKAKKVQ